MPPSPRWLTPLAAPSSPVSPPRFHVTVLFEELPGGCTKVTFRQLFESADDCRKIRGIAVPSNEENFDKLAAELDRMV